MLNTVIIFFFLLNKGITQISKKDMYASVPQLVKAAGYPIEKHYVHTTDGYILQLFRIPGGRNNSKTSEIKKRAVVLVHGLLGGCDNFILMGPQKSLAYLLADAGYDVWLANLRGNLFTSHQSLTRNDPAFWDYSFDEHGKYDAPAFIDKILNITGLSKLLYVGHSMGCTTFLTMMAQKPDYNNKLVAFVGLAPAAYEDNIRGLANYLINKIDLPTLLHKRGIHSLYIPQNIAEFFCDRYCSTRQPQSDVCLKILYAFVGEDYEQHNWDLTKVIIVRVHPASARQMYHFGKIAITGVFTSWEDGIFGAVKPYNLSKIKTPVSIWYGENDQLTEKSQIMRLVKDLNDTGTLYGVNLVQWYKFNHLDFIIAKDVRDLVNIPLIAHIGELYDKFSNDNTTTKT